MLAPSHDAVLSAGRRWLDEHGGQALVVPHGDADGLAAGALLATRARGGVLHVASPWQDHLTTSAPLVIADWGVRPLDTAAPVLYVDHHAEPEPVTAPVVHGDTTGDGSTSMVAWRLLGMPDRHAWLAGLGLVGDLGEPALRHAAVNAGPATPLRRLAGLVSAPGRLRDGPVDVAYAVLTDAASSADALADERISQLAQARDAVAGYRRDAMRVAPRVGPHAALVVLDLPARVHSQVATAWMRRLAPRVVIAANRGWRPGRVSFAVRSAVARDLRAWLRSVFTPAPGSGDYARGHVQATGGALVPESFDAFAAAVLT
jgi:single-stranded-DNA-specific exonuclease